MPHKKLTVKKVASFRAPTPSGKNEIYWDDGTTNDSVRGFGVFCSGSTPTKNYIVQRDINGRSTRFTIAGTNEMSLPEARKAAGTYASQMRQGINPKVKNSCATLGDTLKEFSEKRTLKARSAESYDDLVNRHLQDWLTLPMSSITTMMVESRHNKITSEIEASFRQKARESAQRYRARAAKSKRWPEAQQRYLDLAVKAERREPPNGFATANATMRALRALWNFAAKRNAELGPNPAKLEKWLPVPPREGLVKASDLPAFYKGIMGLENKVARDYLLLVLYTGLRRREAAALRWSDVDLTANTLLIPAANTKSGRKLKLPLVDVVRDMLVKRRKLGDGDWVFLANSGSGHIEEPRYALDEIERQSGVKVTVHDLRRTFLTIAESVDLPMLAMKYLVNHSIGRDTTSGYIIMNVERLRPLAQRVADKIKELARV
jgi:integrase